MYLGAAILITSKVQLYKVHFCTTEVLKYLALLWKNCLNAPQGHKTIILQNANKRQPQRF